MGISKITRILFIFHLFLYSKEVSYQEITTLLGISKKTAHRDIQLLQQAGVLRCRYSKSANAFVPEYQTFIPQPFAQPNWPTSSRQKTNLERILRLCILITEMWGADDPIVWYQQQYPALSPRTRQRDFLELRRIGYTISYLPAIESMDGIGHYEYDEPTDTDSLPLN